MVRFTMLPAILLVVCFHVVWSEIGFESPASQAFLADLGLDKIVSDEATPFLTLVAEDGDKTDGDKKDNQKTDGDENASQKTDGDKTEDPKPDGEKPAQQTDGNNPPDQQTDGDKPPDQQTDGDKPPDQQTDGDKPPDQQTDGGKTDDQKTDDDKTKDNPPEQPGTGGNPEEECAAKLTFKVQVTILGKLGYSNANPSKEEKQEMKDKASKWIFSTLLRSMLRNAEQYKLGEKAVPTITVTTKEPFEATEDGQRSPLERTILDYVFPDTDVCSAAAFGRFLCRDYDSAEEELLTGVLRSLDVAAQYPAAAMQMASKSGLGPKSLITLRAASLEGDSASNFCNWGTKFSSDSVQGALMMPDCPANSVRCEDRENLCTADEAKWKCKCTFGYEGDPKIPGLEQGSIEGPFHIEGECKPISGYCESGKHPMKLHDGSDAKGVLGESATPFCGDGFEASGTSECTEGENAESRKGRWSPEPRCNYLPSTVPGEPFCKTPEHGGTLAPEQCSLCMGVEAGKKGPECNCEVNCAQDHKQMGEIAEGKKDCVASEFPCPKAVLADGRCLDAKTNEVTHFFCCDESWGPNVPPDKLAAAVCSDIKEDKECLTSQQSASGADASKAGEPCCWSRSTRSCSAKSQERQSPCAVAKRVMVADWKDLPTCVPLCEDVFTSGMLDSEGCDTCYPPGAKADSCKCKVSCHMGMVRIGGGPDGDRTCKPDGNEGFGFGLPPVCWPKPAPAPCPSVEGTGRKVEGCDCQAGQKNCKCSVTCRDDFAKTSDGVTSPQCHEKPLQSEVKECRSISDENECLKSFAAKADGVSAAVPCCLRRQKDYANGVSCIPAGDPEISHDKLPDSCAPVTYAEWDELPVCTPLCNADSLKWKDHLVVPTACDACIAGQDCNCSVDCEAGFVRVGGGLTGKRSCTVEELSLGAAPVCRLAQAGEPGSMPTCPQPDVADATGDCRCEPSPDGCVCPVFCKHTHDNIKENVKEGDKKCTIEDKMPPAGTCKYFTSKDDCLSHSQDGEPCCFREEGLYAKCEEDGNCEANKAVVCAARYDERIFFSPSDCAKSLFPKWEEMPDCQPKCVMPPGFSGARHISASEACSGCIAGQPCACEIKCEDNFERVGGGPEGTRSCDINNLEFEEAPLCQAKEAKPDCPAVKSTEAMVASGDCSGCTAEEECDCKVSCATGYAPFTDVQPGNKKCHIDPDYALKPGTCASLTGQDECLAGSEDDVPCCWRGAGFKDEKKCAKKGSSDILLLTPPDSCAPTQKGKMDPLPVCKQLCVNQFSTAPNVNEENCDGCFVGEPCECFVKCEVEMVERAGQKGKKKCGDDPQNPTSFGEPLVCEPRKPPEVPSCKTPQNSFFQFDIEGCKNCKAGDDGCSCSVKCAEGHKKTGGGELGQKKCLSKVYECPISVTWKPEALQCFDTTSNEKVDTFCCPEAVEDKPELDASKECAALTDEKECLKGKDMTTTKACCWRDTGFADGTKCAAHGSSAITNDHRALACADRGRILHAYYEELPVCTKKCRNPYKATSRQSREGSFGLTVSGCEDCVPGEKECPCKVTCVQDWIHVGGGKEDSDKPRMCDDKSMFPPAPTCMPKPDPPKCQKPSGYGYKMNGCESCTAGQPCECSVKCNRGLDASAGKLGDKACELKPASLTEAQCSDLTGRSQCLSSWESKVPCCYRRDGFQNGKVCAKQGDEAIQDQPDSCAPLEMGEFPDLPKCVPICTYTRLQGRSWKSEGSCDHCLADAPCDCQMKCQDGYEFIGGSPPGPRSCSTAEPWLPPPPVCQKIKAIECREPDKGSLKNVEAPFCESCIADSESCRCTAKCVPGHIVKPGSSIQAGLKKCLAEDVPGETACEEITRKRYCIQQVHNGKRCCWQKDHSGTGRCWTEGSPKILKGGVSKPVCSDLKVGKFEEFPECVPACKHKWQERVGLAYDEKVCSQCTPVKYPGVEECKCSVKCAEDYRPVGGGPEGLRSCENDLLKRFEQAPACLKKPEPPVCERPDAPGQIVTGCDCKVGQEKCPCSVKCQEAYSVTSGQIGDMACIEVKNTDLETARCSGSWGRSQCMSRAEMVDGQLKPCCWRYAGFASSLTRCVPEGHELIIEATPPDECAPATKGVFRPLLPSGNILKDNPPLICTPFCKNIFEKKKDLDQSGCNYCQPNEDCPCTVKCRSPLKALAGNEGKRQCLLIGGRAEFQPPPSCVKPCEAPDHLEGTLDVSECKKNCVPGDRDCTCIVKCAAGNFRVDGGQEGEKPCVATSHGPMHTDLPICLPKCVKPEDQFGSLNTKKCASCLANRRCDCDLSCYTKASKNGALNGKKKCEFIAGSEDKPAAADWAPADGNGPNGVPQCLPPIIIKVDDARTKKPLDGVTIVISVPYSSESGLRRPIETLYTSKSNRKDMAVEFSTEQRDIYVELKKEGYTTITRALDRGKNCKDASKCEFRFALSEELKGGHLSPDGCFIVGDPKTIEWDMRAVLEWGESPADLDIWARNYDCYRDVEKAYDCTGKNPTTFERSSFTGWKTGYTMCKRRLFRQRNVRNSEIEACGTRFCTQDEQRTAFSSKTGRPLCLSYKQKAYNQYDKWVFWDVRYASDLQKRCYRSGIEDSYPKINCNGWARHAKDWNQEHHILLDVDEQSGHGPETISFKNVPPGTYQVVVNQWTTTSRKVRDRFGNKVTAEDIAYANPRVNLYIGGNSIRFECLIPDSCLSQVRIWNVVNVEVKDIGPYENGKNGERKYQIRLIDSRDEIQPLRWVEMPTRRDERKREWTQKDTQNQEYWQMGTATEYPDGYLRQACVGQCEPADAGYKECLARTQSRRLAEDLSNFTRS